MDTPETPVRSMILDGYASPSFGALIGARAKAAGEIKAIVKDKTAKIPNKNGGPGYAYAYADLADVIEAVEDALSKHELVVIQQTQERARGAFLVTILGHSSGEWIASEIRLQAISGGPQAHGSELTYLRRYQLLSLLGLAPERDDDGQAAQQRADQSRYERNNRPPARPVPVPTASEVPDAAEVEKQRNPDIKPVKAEPEMDLSPPGIQKFEADLKEKLDAVADLDALDDLWRSGINASIRKIGEKDNIAQKRMIEAFTAKKDELLKREERKSA